MSPTSTTTYEVVVTGGGCQESDEVEVTIDDGPPLNVLNVFYPQGKDKLCNDPTNSGQGCATAFVSTSSGANLTVSPNATVTPLGFGGLFMVEFCSNTTTDYTLTATNADGCTSEQTVTIEVGNCKCEDFNPTATWTNQTSSSLGGPSFIGNATISGTFTVDNTFTLANADVLMEANAEIIVQNGATLTITSAGPNASHLFSCTQMWKGITVKGGGELIVNGESLIEDAMIGVELENGSGATPSKLTLENARLNKNLDHVVVRPFFDGVHPATISGTRFTCEAVYSSSNNELLPPHSGEYTDRGVVLWSVEQPNTLTGGFIIGDPQADSNYFDHMKFGVFANESSFEVKNSNFTDIDRTSGGLSCSNPPCEGTAIFGSAAKKGWVNIGAVPQGTGQHPGNTFRDCFHAVELENYEVVDILGNVMNNPVITDPNPGLVGVRGVLIRESVEPWAININSNEIEDYRNGIKFVNLVKGEGDGELGIDNNLIGNPHAHTNMGIIVESVPPFTGINTWHISGNDISESRLGVRVMNFKHPDFLIAQNHIETVSPGSFPVSTTGIDVQNTTYLQVSDNTIVGDGSILARKGILLSSSGAIQLRCNEISNVGQGIQLNGTAPATGFLSNTVVSNDLSGFYRGLSLTFGSELSDQGSSSVASANRWLKAPGDADTWVDQFSNNNGTVLWVNPVLNPYVPTVNNSVFSIAVSNTDPGAILPACLPFQSPSRETALERIAGDSIQYVYEPSSSEWTGDQRAYRTIKGDPALPGQNQLLDSYEDSLDNANMGRIRSIDRSVDADSLNKADNLNNAMSCTCPIEQGYKRFFGAFLNSAAADSSCDAVQLQTLWEIARECALKKGEAVYRARVLLRSELDSNIHFSPDCTPDSTAPAQKPEGWNSRPEVTGVEEEQELARFSWKPNPTGGRTKLSYELGERSQVRLRVLDMQGRLVEEQLLKGGAGELVLDLSRSGAGSYSYRVTEGGTLLKAGRLVVTR